MKVASPVLNGGDKETGSKENRASSLPTTQMVMLGERSLSYAIQQYLAYYHYERNHQGLDNHLIARAEGVGCHTGHVVRRQRLGGLLSYYHREAA